VARAAQAMPTTATAAALKTQIEKSEKDAADAVAAGQNGRERNANSRAQMLAGRTAWRNKFDDATRHSRRL